METGNISKSAQWTGRIMSGIVILFMVFDATLKFLKPAEVIGATADLGYLEHHILPMGLLAITATILYAIPATSILGGILLTGYFGGAIATHMRLDNPAFSHTLFPVYLAVLMWGGVWLRNQRVRKLIPLNN